jgi:hypothetical protein
VRVVRITHAQIQAQEQASERERQRAAELLP